MMQISFYLLKGPKEVHTLKNINLVNHRDYFIVLIIDILMAIINTFVH